MSLCDHSWVSLTWYKLAFRVTKLVSRVASCLLPCHSWNKSILKCQAIHCLGKNIYSFVSCILLKCAQSLSLHILYPGTLPPDPLETALFEDEDVRFPEERKFVLQNSSRACKSPVSSSSSPLTPDVFFMKAGDTIISSSMATTYKQGVFSASQFFLRKKQLSPACPTSWQAWPHPPASSACQESWDERTFIRGLQIW